MSSRLMWKLARFLRTVGRPVWRIKIKGEPLWKHLGSLFYRLPLASDSVQLKWGHTLYFPPRFHGRVEYYLGTYEPELTNYIIEVVRPGMQVIDAGANIGYYTLLLSHLVGAEGQVYAFEPVPALYQALVHNIQSNRLSNVQAFPYALGDFSGEIDFYADSTGVSSSVLPDDNLPLRSIRVQMVTLDEVIPPEATIAFTKIDVEGAELACLRGMSRVLQRSPNAEIILELNLSVLAQLGISPQEYLQKLELLGLHSFRVLEYALETLTLANLPHLLSKMSQDKRKVINLVARVRGEQS